MRGTKVLHLAADVLAELVVAAYIAFFIVVGVFLRSEILVFVLANPIFWLVLVISGLYLARYRVMKARLCVTAISVFVVAFLAVGSLYSPFWEGPGFSYDVSVAYQGSWRVDYRGYQGTGGSMHPSSNSTWGTFSGNGPRTMTVFVPESDSNGASICVSATKLDTLASNLTLSVDGFYRNSTSLTDSPVTVCISSIE